MNLTDRVRVDAWLRATVACSKCQGTGIVRGLSYPGLASWSALKTCPGPHTQIRICPDGAEKDIVEAVVGKGAHETLYANPDRVDFFPLPPGWTVLEDTDAG